MATFQDTFDNNDNIATHEGTETSGGVLRNVLDDNVARASSTDLLSSVSSDAVNSYKYTLAGKPGGREIRVQFSDDNFTTIKNSSGDSVINGGGRTFDGVDDFIQGTTVSDFRNGDSSGTCTAWMKATGGGGATRNQIFGVNQTDSLYFGICHHASINAFGILGFTTGGNSEIATPAGSIVLGKWHHVAAVCNGSSTLLYVDGVSLPVAGINGGSDDGDWFGSIASAVNITSGMLKATGSFGAFEGTIDDIRVYSQQLTADQIFDLYSKHDTAFAPVAHWKFDTDVLDSGSEGADFNTISGAISETDFNNLPQFGEALGNTNTLDFDGVDDRIDMGSDSSIDNVFAGGATVMFWIYPRTAGGSSAGIVLTKRPSAAAGWLISAALGSGSNIKLNFLDVFSTTNGDYVTDTIVPLYEWSHFAVTLDTDSDASPPIFYLNGEVITVNVTSAHSGTYNDDSAITLFSGANQGLVQEWDGRISNIAMFNSILSSADITTEYENGFTDILHANYIDSWGFSEGTGNPSSEQGLSTTLLGASWIKTIDRPGVDTPSQQTIDLSGLSFTTSVYVRTAIQSLQGITPNSFTSQEEITIDFDATPSSSTNLTLLGVGP